MNVTADEVKAAALAAGIEKVDVRECGMCQYQLAYYIREEAVFFDPGCDCTYGGRLEPRAWGDAANLINMQTQQKWRNKFRVAFGLPTENTQPSPLDAGNQIKESK